MTNMHSTKGQGLSDHTKGRRGAMVVSRFHFMRMIDGIQKQNINNKGVYHIVALPFTLKSILKQKKNYENSNISRCKNIMFKKIL
jgi:hypothetical protein